MINGRLYYLRCRILPRHGILYPYIKRRRGYDPVRAIHAGNTPVDARTQFFSGRHYKIDYLVNKLKIKKFTLYIHPYIAAFVNQGFFSLKRKWQMQYGFGIKVVPDQSLAFLQYRFTDEHKEEIDMKEEIEIK